MALQAKKFRETPAPINYVAGLGRGATGFTTRSDIGPARDATPTMPMPGQAPDFGAPPPGYVAGRGRGMGGTVLEDDQSAAAKEMAEEAKKENFSDSNYDEFGGYGQSLFAGDPYDADDVNADKLWSMVDDRMDSRRKKRREEAMQAEIEKYRVARPKIQLQFADLKKELATVSADEWALLPEHGTTASRKRARPDRYTPVPDNVMLSSAAAEMNTNQIDVNAGFQTPYTPIPGAQTVGGTVTNLNEIGTARKTVLNLKLHQVSDSVSGQTVVDPKGYLTDLNSIAVNTDAEIGDIKKARLLLRSVTTTNPKHGPGWIAAARLEEVAGRLSTARKLIKQGCQECPDSADVWLEAARLQTPANAAIVLSKAVRHIPHSVKIWLQAASLEKDMMDRRLVLRKALEYIPNSPKLWKAAIELEQPDDARVMLSRAVECVPTHVPMWLALAKLETYENARKVLNKARETIPTDSRIWITAAQLEEANGNEGGVRMIITRAVKSLEAHQVVMDREQWLKEAEDSEANGFPITCQALVKETVALGVDDEDRKATWMEDAESCLAHGNVQTARAIYAHALSVFPGKKSLWLREAYLEKQHGTRETLDAMLKQAVGYCPQAEILWLMAAKEKWLAEDVDSARTILTEAFRANPDSEQIWLAAVKLESENNEPDRARELLARARERAGTERVWIKSIQLEREVGDLASASSLVEAALKNYPQSPKLWMMKGQIQEKQGNREEARKTYARGLQNIPKNIPLWLVAAELEENPQAGPNAGNAARARSLLEKARLKNPKTPELWQAAIEVEQRAGNQKIAETLLAKALQECATSGILWALAISMEPRPRQTSKSVDALRRCDNDPYVLVAVACMFWADHKLDKARAWFNKAIPLNPDLGDTWAVFYKFEQQQQQVKLKTGDAKEAAESTEILAKLSQKCAQAEPHHGRAWCRVSKQVGNARLTPSQLLPMVAAAIKVPFPV